MKNEACHRTNRKRLLQGSLRRAYVSFSFLYRLYIVIFIIKISRNHLWFLRCSFRNVRVEFGCVVKIAHGDDDSPRRPSDGEIDNSYLASREFKLKTRAREENRNAFVTQSIKRTRYLFNVLFLLFFFFSRKTATAVITVTCTR